MPKKTTSVKALAKMEENPVVEDSKKPKKSLNKIDEKSLTKPKKSSNEIDEIFAAKKRKKLEVKKTDKLNKDETVELKLVKKKKEKNESKRDVEGGFADPPARARKRTEDGLTIYTKEELGINKADAGSTPLCPFDCSCCF